MEYKEKVLILDIFFVILFTLVWIIVGMIYIGCKQLGLFNPLYDLLGQHKLDWVHYVFVGVGIFIYFSTVIYCIFFNKTPNKYLTAFLKTLIFLAIVIAVLVCSYLPFLKFSTESWQKNIRERFIMFEDLKENYNIIGMDKSNVNSFLGKCDDIEGDDYIYVYDSGYICVYFENEAVVSIEIFDSAY